MKHSLTIVAIVAALALTGCASDAPTPGGSPSTSPSATPSDTPTATPEPTETDPGTETADPQPSEIADAPVDAAGYPGFPEGSGLSNEQVEVSGVAATWIEQDAVFAISLLSSSTCTPVAVGATIVGDGQIDVAMQPSPQSVCTADLGPVSYDFPVPVDYVPGVNYTVTVGGLMEPLTATLPAA